MARPGRFAEPEAALPCPCADAGGLGLPSLKNNKRVSKGDLSKEDLSWPLALTGAQEVSAHQGCSKTLLPGGFVGCLRGAAGAQDPCLIFSGAALVLGAGGIAQWQMQYSFTGVVFVFIFKFLIYIMSAAAGGCGA